ncbi:cell division protease FtsH [Monoraphidium neglectum]|uniref:Cell division protease FtsH n=1 Tax=Monoraphidium neglectum TaxID=145388 RepID=A0A0D2KAS4_9CHLO|nr:cell division protease FtsH [Monoraphidium neglectum]KIY93083.1 cell division protease FtsH [Monoraphidium neglectum]|eukprot:XP_013892103.1 cell division protease FtsH [Monoraphidium neglectum]
MRALFAAAKKKAPCIVFIDEIDAIGGNRKHWENHTRKTLNQLLVEMDGFEANEGVIVMAATNLPETLDPALKRPGRFDRQVAVPLPDVKGRSEILQYYMKDKPFASDVDPDLLARQTSGFSGADLSNLVNEAALLAAQRDATAISAPMIDYAYDKILMGVERKTAVRSQEALRRTAYHESGHALVALLTPGASPIHKATIVPRGHALGMVTQAPGP